MSNKFVPILVEKDEVKGVKRQRKDQDICCEYFPSWSMFDFYISNWNCILVLIKHFHSKVTQTEKK